MPIGFIPPGVDRDAGVFRPVLNVDKSVQVQVIVIGVGAVSKLRERKLADVDLDLVLVVVVCPVHAGVDHRDEHVEAAGADAKRLVLPISRADLELRRAHRRARTRGHVRDHRPVLVEIVGAEVRSIGDTTLWVGGQRQNGERKPGGEQQGEQQGWRHDGIGLTRRAGGESHARIQSSPRAHPSLTAPALRQAYGARSIASWTFVSPIAFRAALKPTGRRHATPCTKGACKTKTWTRR